MTDDSSNIAWCSIHTSHPMTCFWAHHPERCKHGMMICPECGDMKTLGSVEHANN